MSQESGVLLAVLLSSLLPGVFTFFLREEQHVLRGTLNLGGALLKLLFVGYLTWGVYHGRAFELVLPFLPGLPLRLHADALSLFLVVLSAVLWLCTTVYAIGYLEHSPNRSRFFGFFSLCVTTTVGFALAEDLLTFLVFYELLTLTTYPLVAHRGTEKALRAARTYLSYTLGGGALLLLTTAWLYHVTGTLAFREQGFVGPFVSEHGIALRVIFALFVAGFGVKAALVPLHGWLPRAMVAPAPVSALLHAVAVVKAGAFGIVRVISDVYGIELSDQMGILGPLAIAASATILFGSLLALVQDELKRRLAYSTVSQVSYITLGMALGSPAAALGGIVHLVHQGLMKITLFFCAGNVAEATGIHRISEMAGLGRRMPWTMASFTVAAFGMIGVPPVAGFVTKWYLGMGALASDQPWVIAVLVASSLLNAAYFLPIVHTVWFAPARDPEGDEGNDVTSEPPWALVAPTLATAALSLLVGLFASVGVSPLAWAKLIASREFGL